MARKQKKQSLKGKNQPNRRKHQIDANHVLSIAIKAPQELAQNYDFLQHQLDRALNDQTARQAILAIDIDQQRGTYWQQLRDELRRVFPGTWDADWKINNPAWHGRIVYENIRRIATTYQRQKTIWDAIQENEQQNLTSIRKQLKQHKIKATNAEIKNLTRHDKTPELPFHDTFVLDYSVGDKQFCHWDENDPGCFAIHYGVGKDEWIGYKILLPASIRPEANGCVASPIFFKDDDGVFVGRLSYEYSPNPTPGSNVMGVDIGKLHTYTASIFTPSGRQFGPTFTDSERLEACVVGVKRRYEELKRLSRVIGEYEKGHPDEKTWSSRHRRRRENLLRLREAITNARLSLSRLAADEIVRIAVENQVGEIHLEELSWLGSTGGLWDHARLHSLICDRAKVDGVRVVFVRCSHSSDVHPVTGEVGRESGRLIVFDASDVSGVCDDGSILDRDVCASVNLVERFDGSDSRSVSVRCLRRGFGRTRRFRPRRRSRGSVARERRLSVNNNGEGVNDSDVVSFGVCSGVFIVASRPTSEPVKGLCWGAYPKEASTLPDYSSLPRQRGNPKHTV